MALLAAPHQISAPEYQLRFRDARPFRHLVIDSFFAADFIDRLTREFPAFERGNARNEQGELGGKSTVERIRELGPAYVALDEWVQSQAFLQWLSTATGIPDLRYDPWYFGGGTHDNRHGQELDPHVDFNRHPETGQHRRLNLIVYLNQRWEDDWGGALELHSDPRSEQDEVSLITPSYNRCVVFETTEWSWHGFSRIGLPESEQHRSRRSIALYFYTEHRPSDELAPEHSTIYVDRPLPERFRPGLLLSERDVQELRTLLARRDQHNQRLYQELVDLTQQLRPRPPIRSALASASRGLLRYLRGPGELHSREKLKQSLIPLVTGLPTPLREWLRRSWRRWHRQDDRLSSGER